MTLAEQTGRLFLLAIPVACVAWTVTHEEVFREFKEYCSKKNKECARLAQRKFFYLFTCEYCFSHYVTILMLCMTGFTMLYEDWRGYVISGFSMVWIANSYMSLFAWLRTSLKKERAEAELEEAQVRQSGSDR